jgi:hypothetical protein
MQRQKLRSEIIIKYNFERRDNGSGKMEWRITEWRQNEYSKEQIEAGWKQ